MVARPSRKACQRRGEPAVIALNRSNAPIAQRRLRPSCPLQTNPTKSRLVEGLEKSAIDTYGSCDSLKTTVFVLNLQAAQTAGKEAS